MIPTTLTTSEAGGVTEFSGRGGACITMLRDACLTTKAISQMRGRIGHLLAPSESIS